MVEYGVERRRVRKFYSFRSIPLLLPPATTLPLQSPTLRLWGGGGGGGEGHTL